MTPTLGWPIVSTNKFWMPITLNGNYGNFLYFVEPQPRFVEPKTPQFNRRNSVFNQFLGNFAGGHKIYRGWDFWLGQTISTIAQDAVERSREEYRIWEQLMWNYQTQKDIKINSRFRAEQRKSLDFPQWAFRIRERLIINFPLTNNMSYEISDELLYNLNSVPWIDTTAFDQNRAYIAVVQTFSKNYAFAIGYMNQYLFRDPPFAQANNVLFLNLRYNLPT
ncbi:MAG: DUF2490 domain-containing protein [Legionellaceae bacterium]|nr:DUF2490 domain-containing protein [Legionellaceae bacterium]